MKGLRQVLAVLLAVLSGSAGAARPFFTDDARIVDRGHCQVETFYKEQRTYSGSEFWVLPACNPLGFEFTLGANRVEREHNAIVQAKFLFKELQTNGWGYALSLGSFGGDPYFNGIASRSFLDDRAVVHANLGAIRGPVDRGTWGLGLEALLVAPQLYGIAETFGQRGDKATRHFGLRYWVVPGRFQIDATRGDQDASPARRFYSLGLRFIF